MEDRDYILFEDYLTQSLTETERNAFEKRLDEDTAFREAFELYKETSAFLEHKFSDTTERDAFKENLSKISSTHSVETKAPSKKIRLLHPWKLAVAASIVVIVGVFYAQWFTTPVYQDFADYPQISLTVRGESNQIKAEAENAFNAQNYQDALPLFKSLLETEPENTEIQLYLAVSLVEENAFAEADSLFDTLLKEPSAYLNLARWYASLSKLKQKEYAETEAILRLIPEEAEEYPQAQKLLKKLK
ncbi:MAG: tetratricopeptide repeat protein [Flavobacteriaceae bacterium]